jgi:hypothetical protein
MCGCGCELAMILANARPEAEPAAAATSGAWSGVASRPDPFELMGRALVDAICRVSGLIASLVPGWGAVR